MIEDANGVIKNRKSMKYRQSNDQKKTNNEQTMIY